MAMTPEERKRAIREKGLTYKAIGNKARPKPLSANTIYANVHELPGAKSERARRLIARSIGKPYEEVYAA
jgi:hypothetical protein